MHCWQVEAGKCIVSLWRCELYDTEWEQNRNAKRREGGKGGCRQKKGRDEGRAQEFIML